MQKLNEDISLNEQVARPPIKQYWVRQKRENDPYEKYVDPENQSDKLIIYEVTDNQLHGEFAGKNPHLFNRIGTTDFEEYIKRMMNEYRSKFERYGDDRDMDDNFVMNKFTGDFTMYLIQEKWIRIRNYVGLGFGKWFIDCKTYRELRNVITDFVYWAIFNNIITKDTMFQIDEFPSANKYDEFSHRTVKVGTQMEVIQESKRYKEIISDSDILKIMSVGGNNNGTIK